MFKRLLCRLFGHDFEALTDGSPFCLRCEHLPHPDSDEFLAFRGKETARKAFEAADVYLGRGKVLKFRRRRSEKEEHFNGGQS
jgi:hypothetical protein